MTTDFTAEAEKLAELCRGIFGDETKWISPDDYPRNLALCINDSIFSTGSHYTHVIDVVNGYRATGARRLKTPSQQKPGQSRT
ncbi:hypothetical protein ACSBOX_11600 [Arthrobacter sp. KN11-1C]|uniref:hypothetical protein n=1 Tax=Arthrobacter sp. KN11-1C TaxID=3445774 RepID=UPI003F9F393C